MIQVLYLKIPGHPLRADRHVAYHLNDYGQVVAAGTGLTRRAALRRMSLAGSLNTWISADG